MDNPQSKVNLRRHPNKGVLLDVAKKMKMNRSAVQKRWKRNDAEVSILVLRELIRRSEKEEKSSRLLRELLAQLGGTQD